MAAPPTNTDREIFVNSLVTVGYVHCAADHPSFSTPSYVRGHRFVFPCQSVWIQSGRSRRYVSDPSVVEYHNDGEEFSRQALDPRGDRTHWYQIGDADLRDVVRRYDPVVAERPSPFRFTHGPTESHAYVVQRTLFHRLVSKEPPGELEVVEAVFDALDRVLSRAYQGQRAARQTAITRDEREIADRASAVVTGMTTGRVTFRTIGREAGVSLFHLSRVFRKVTGRTLAKHHLHLRLLASLTPLGESDAAIAEVATNHGFAGPSHYSRVFRQMFGATPSTYRALATAPRRCAIDSALAQRTGGSGRRL